MTAHCIKHNKSLSCCVCVRLSLYLFCLAVHFKQNIWIRDEFMQSYIVIDPLVWVCSEQTINLCISEQVFFFLWVFVQVTSEGEWWSESFVQPILWETVIHLGIKQVTVFMKKFNRLVPIIITYSVIKQVADFVSEGMIQTHC